MNKKTIAAALVAVVAIAGIAYWSLGSANAPLQGSSAAAASGNKAITIWRDPSCGCCDAYADYLEGNGYEVTRVDDRDFDKRSIEAGVPERGIGCHLAEIDGYIVSGLVPVKIIERLVSERPDITGITLPGMPANAPGMAQKKTGTLKTYAFGDGGVTVYSEE
ncbi:MAG: metal-binding protein [Rhizobiales bacterium]|nr:metal-binding protein [Hyphomicrobiales bacterium]